MSPEAKLWRREYMGTFDPPLPPILTDEELDFMSMAIPLRELVKGLGGHEVPRDVVALAHHCIDGGYGDEVLERLRKIFAVRGTTEQRLHCALKQTVAYAAEAFRRLGCTQAAFELEQRDITRLKDIQTHIGRMRVDYRSYEGQYVGRVAQALLSALGALRVIGDHAAAPPVYETFLKNSVYLEGYATHHHVIESHAAKKWIATLDEWLNAPLVESRP